MSETAYPPRGPSDEEMLESARQLLDGTGAIRFEALSEAQREQLSTITIPRLGGQPGERIACINILEPGVERVEQEPFHLLKEDEDFLRKSSNMSTAFSDANLYDVFDSWAHWQRFGVVAPQLNAWLQQREREFRVEVAAVLSRVKEDMGLDLWYLPEDSAAHYRAQLPVRDATHMAALRLAYQIASQLVCLGDQAVGPDSHRILMH